MFSKYQLPQFIAGVQQTKVGLIVILFIPAFTSTAQNLPKKPTLQQLAGYQNQQQINWQQKQLPQSSVTYKFTANYNQPQPIANKKLQPAAIVPVNYVLPAATHPQPQMSSSLLQSLLMQERKDYMQWQKQSWWKDPNKLKGAELLRDFYIGNKKG